MSLTYSRKKKGVRLEAGKRQGRRTGQGCQTRARLCQVVQMVVKTGNVILSAMGWHWRSLSREVTHAMFWLLWKNGWWRPGFKRLNKQLRVLRPLLVCIQYQGSFPWCPILHTVVSCYTGISHLTKWGSHYLQDPGPASCIISQVRITARGYVTIQQHIYSNLLCIHLATFNT